MMANKLRTTALSNLKFQVSSDEQVHWGITNHWINLNLHTLQHNNKIPNNQVLSGK